MARTWVSQVREREANLRQDAPQHRPPQLVHEGPDEVELHHTPVLAAQGEHPVQGPRQGQTERFTWEILEN